MLKIKKLISENRRAYHDYFILHAWEAGVQLIAGEVKTVRKHGINISEAHVRAVSNELWIVNMQLPVDITQLLKPEHQMPRKLLLHRREIKKICGYMCEQRITVIPLKIYFNNLDKIKILIALAKGKRKYDKRQVTKDREWKRAQSRIIKF